MAIHFSEVLSKMKGSDLGPLLALTAQPDIISFAGGLPAPRTFPLKELTEVAVKVREEEAPALCSTARPSVSWDFARLLPTA